MDVMLGGKDSLLVGRGGEREVDGRWKCRMGGQLCSATRRTFVCCPAASLDLSKELPGGKKDTRDQTLMRRGWLVRQHSASRKRLLHASIPVDPEMLDGARVTLYMLQSGARMIYEDRCDGSFEMIQP